MPSLESELKSKLQRAETKVGAPLPCRVSNTTTGLHLYLHAKEAAELIPSGRLGMVSIDSEQMELMITRGSLVGQVPSGSGFRWRWSIDPRYPKFGQVEAKLRPQPNGTLLIQLPQTLPDFRERQSRKRAPSALAPLPTATSETDVITAIRLLNSVREAFGLRFSVTPEGALSARIEKELA